MEWSRLVDLVQRVRATSKKTEKVALIAELLRQTNGRETELAALYSDGLAATGPDRPRLAHAAAGAAVGARGGRAPDAAACRRGARIRGRGNGAGLGRAAAAHPARPLRAGRRGRPAPARRAADRGAAAGRPRRARGRGDREGGRAAAGRRAPRRDVRGQRRGAGARGPRRGRFRPRPVLAAPAVAGGADARESGGRRRRGALSPGRGGVRVQARRRAAAGAPRGRRGARLHAPAPGRDGARARGGRVGAGAAGPRAGGRRRGPRAAPGRTAAAVPGDDAPPRSQQGRGRRPRRAAAVAVLLRPALPRRRGPARLRPLRRARRAARASRRAVPAPAPSGHARSRRGGALLRARVGGRATRA